MIKLDDYVRVGSYGRYDNQNYGAHTMQVEVGDMTVYFSYSTPVAFRAPGYGTMKSENVWSRTTGKHLGMIGYGNTIPHEEWETMYRKALAENVLPPKDAIRKAMLDIARTA